LSVTGSNKLVIMKTKEQESHMLHILAPKKSNLKSNATVTAEGALKVDGCLAVFAHLVRVATK
jgi:hypothetical protein